MKFIIFFLLTGLVLVFILSRCTDPPSGCNCHESWDNFNIYYPGDQRSHRGVCYEAVAPNSNVEPGPWAVHWNDSWIECQP